MTEPKANPIAPPARLTIDRSKWLRGGPDTESRLLRPSDGKMCCLGFFGLLCGLTPAQLEDHSAPYQTAQGRWPAWINGKYGTRLTSDDCGDLMETNDDPEMDDADREARIAAGFLKHGVVVEFIEDASKGDQ